MNALRDIDPDLLAQVSAPDLRDALRNWSWLLPAASEPIALTAGGDVLLLDAQGAVLLLDCGGGVVNTVASSVTEFEAQSRLAGKRADWFQTVVLGDLAAAGKTLSAGQCFGYTVLPVFREGSYQAGNRFALDALEYVRFTGDVHGQIADAPDGTSVEFDWQ